MAKQFMQRTAGSLLRTLSRTSEAPTTTSFSTAITAPTAYPLSSPLQATSAALSAAFQTNYSLLRVKTPTPLYSLAWRQIRAFHDSANDSLTKNPTENRVYYECSAQDPSKLSMYSVNLFFQRTNSIEDCLSFEPQKQPTFKDVHNSFEIAIERLTEYNKLFEKNDKHLEKNIFSITSITDHTGYGVQFSPKRTAKLLGNILSHIQNDSDMDKKILAETQEKLSKIIACIKILSTMIQDENYNFPSPFMERIFNQEITNDMEGIANNNFLEFIYDKKTTATTVLSHKEKQNPPKVNSTRTTKPKTTYEPAI